MKIFAIADLHLPAQKKPMDIFGAHWERHFERIAQDWRARVAPEDVVTLEEAREDLDSIGALPGRKLLLRGNHDYWWNSISRVRDALAPGMFAIQNDAVFLDGVLFAGSRGWTSLSGEAADEKILQRERMRLEMSLKAARALNAAAPLYVMAHYPPLSPEDRDNEVTAMLSRYSAKCVAYGHLHGAAIRHAFEGEWGGVRYHLVSCDALGFALRLVGEECARVALGAK